MNDELPLNGLSFVTDTQLEQLCACFEKLQEAVIAGEACPPTLEADIWHLVAHLATHIWAKAGAWEDANMEEVLRYREAADGTARTD